METSERAGFWLRSLAVLELVAGIGFNKWLLETTLVADGAIESPWVVFSICLVQLALLVAGARTWLLATKIGTRELPSLIRRERPWLAVVLLASVGAIWLAGATPGDSFDQIFGSYRPWLFAANLMLTLTAGMIFLVFRDIRGWKRQTVNAVVCVATVVLVPLVLEIPAALGWVDYRRIFVARGLGFEGPHNRIYTEDGYYHRPAYDRFTETRPGDSAVSLGGGTGRLYTSHHRYDEHGFRNRPGLSAPRLLLVGDSFVEGYRVTQLDTVSERLSELLGIGVANYGQTGFSAHHGLSVLRSRVERVDPEIVVWFIFEGNDLPPRGSSYERFLEGMRRKAASQASFGERSFVRNFSAAAAFWSTLAVRSWSRADRASLRTGHLVGKAPGPETAIYFQFEPPVYDRDRLAEFQTTLVEGKSVCDRIDAKLLLLFVPIKHGVYGALVEYPKGSEVAQWRNSGLATRLAEWSDRQGIAFLDLGPALRDAAREGRLVYFLDDAHWSPEGHDAVAREVGRQLLESGWLGRAVPATSQDRPEEH